MVSLTSRHQRPCGFCIALSTLKSILSLTWWLRKQEKHLRAVVTLVRLHETWSNTSLYLSLGSEFHVELSQGSPI